MNIGKTSRSNSSSSRSERMSLMSFLQEASGVIEAVTGLKVKFNAGGGIFSACSSGESVGVAGILSMRCDILQGTAIHLKCEMLRAPWEARIPVHLFSACMAQLSRDMFILPSVENTDGKTSSLWVCIEIPVNGCSGARIVRLEAELRGLNDIAGKMQKHSPQRLSKGDLIKKYEPYADSLSPVMGISNCEDDALQSLMSWAYETVEYLEASLSVAVSSDYPALEAAALSAIAEVCMQADSSLGVYTAPSAATRRLPEIFRKAPGYVVVPAAAMSMGTNPYEIGNETRALLRSLSSLNLPGIFTGSFDDLQSVFHGGQGGKSDPLFPVVRTIPTDMLNIENLIRFSIANCGCRGGGLPSEVVRSLSDKTNSFLSGRTEDEQKRILTPVAARMVNNWRKIGTKDLSGFAEKIAGNNVTLTGLGDKPGAKRSPKVQEKFIQVLTDRGLLSFLKQKLLGQDEALDELTMRLQMEILTRPLHQPIRYCTQGTPGTGKSESARMLAERLEIPYINIDAASLPDYYTASAQLLGSGRGLVGSYQSGRLEQAAKHHAGALMEISDLDHAAPQVRSALADLFLQTLDLGEAQSAAGSMFSCANLILAFTMNLPDGLDESVRKSMGFAGTPNRLDISKKVETEIKNMLSSAFLSRIGTPILFDPLSKETLAAIIEKSVKDSIKSAAERFNNPNVRITVIKGTGETLLKGIKGQVTSFGARRIFEHGRTLASKAFLQFYKKNHKALNKLTVTAESPEMLMIKNRR